MVNDIKREDIKKQHRNAHEAGIDEDNRDVLYLPISRESCNKWRDYTNDQLRRLLHSNLFGQNINLSKLKLLKLYKSEKEYKISYIVHMLWMLFISSHS